MINKLRQYFSKQWSLGRQIAFALISAMVLVSLVGGIIVREIETKELLESGHKQHLSKFNILYSSAFEAVISEDIPVLESILQHVSKNDPDVDSIAIFNEQGSRIAYWASADSDNEKSLMKLDRRFTLEGETFGRMAINWNIQSIYKDIEDHVLRARLFLGGILLLMTIIVVLLMHRITVRPIIAINEKLKRIAAGELDPQLNINTSVEMQRLAASVNELSTVIKVNKKVQADLRKANKTKSDFLAVMSHEIRTPLNAVIGATNLLQETALSDEQKKFAHIASTSGESLMATINDILDFSKAEAGKLKLEYVNFNISDIVYEVKDLLAVQVEHKGLTFDVQIDARVPEWCTGDSGRLRQILLNLAGNAVKFTTEGTVTISVSVDGNTYTGTILRFEVRDTGIGIDPTVQKNLFEEFSQVDPSFSRKFGGTGLGLAISKKLVNLMGGKIGCISEKGKGSNFNFTAEFYPASANMLFDNNKRRQINEGGMGQLSVPASTDRKGRILLVEDSAANQVVALAMLRKAGFTVDAVANGLEAVAAVRSLPYDLVLMDLAMPEMDGITATRMIRNLQGAMSKITIVAMTANAMHGDRQICIDAGMNDYVAKPIVRTELFRVLDKYLVGINKFNDGCVNEKSMSENNLIDPGVLQQLETDVGTELVPEMMGIFVRETGKRIIIMEAARKNEDILCLQQEAHVLKSSAGTYGATSLQRVATSVDLACKEGRTIDAIMATDKLLPIARESLSELQSRYHLVVVDIAPAA